MPVTNGKYVQMPWGVKELNNGGSKLRKGEIIKPSGYLTGWRIPN